MKSKIDAPAKIVTILVGLVVLVSPTLTNAQATQDTASSQIQNTIGHDPDRGFNYGWLGLLGLAGFAGLRRREPVLNTRLATETR